MRFQYQGGARGRGRVVLFVSAILARREPPWRMHLVWRQKITELTPVRPPLATGVRRRPRARQPLLRVGFEGPIIAADLMGLELPLPNTPVNRVPAGLEECCRLHHGEHTTQQTHNCWD
jgi:hypothetical protein